MDIDKAQTTNTLFRLVVDYVYKELLNEFINNNAVCKSSTFNLLNWSNLIENKDTGNNF